MKRFVDSLKKKYKERLLYREEQWPPVSVERLINLQLVDANKKEGFRAGLPQYGARDNKVECTPILYDDLFEAENCKKPVRKVIVEGNAGIGKTTLCTMLTEEWANGKIFTQFDCVLLLPLRERSVSTATTLSQLFKLFHSSERIRTSVIEELEEREGEGVLIIADGWDELDQKYRCADSFLYNLFFSDILSFASILLTSRPFDSAPLHNLPIIDRSVEVVGFNEENVKQYIESEFRKCPKKASSLIEQLENNPVIQSVSSVPLNCAIICNLWRTMEGKLSRTLTELYAQIVLSIVLRNSRKKLSDSPISLPSFDSLPENLQEVFWLACKFSFECLARDQIMFLEHELVSLLPRVLESSDKILCLGLLQCARSLLPVGQGLSFHFVHLTIQEFLAALHLVTLPNEEKLKVCETHASTARFAMMWRFVFGLGCRKDGSYSKKVICLNGKVIDLFLSTIDNSYVTSDCRQLNKLRLMLCHCSLESSCDIVCSKIARQINGQFDDYIYMDSMGDNRHDCVAVLQVLRYTSHCSCLNIFLSNCTINDDLLKELADILCTTGRELQARDLSLKRNKLTDEGVTNLFDKASSPLSSLESLSLSSNCIAAPSIRSIFSSCRNLRYLFLSNNPLEASGIQSLETAVQAGVLANVERLGLANTLTGDADINGALLATLLPSIASHCSYLEELDISSNSLGIPGASALGESFALLTGTTSPTAPADESCFNSKSEVHLDLSYANFNIRAIEKFAMTTNKHSEPLCECVLNLSHNPLGYDGLLIILKMLRNETCPVSFLVLSSTTLAGEIDFDAAELPDISNAVSLHPTHESSRLTHLDLSDNNFSGDKVILLAECVWVCKSLGELVCYKCSLTSRDILNFIDRLKGFGSTHKLWGWVLYNNSIDDEGVVALVESIPKLFPSLVEVYLHGNPVSDEAEKRLKTIIHVSVFSFLLFSLILSTHC